MDAAPTLTNCNETPTAAFSCSALLARIDIITAAARKEIEKSRTMYGDGPYVAAVATGKIAAMEELKQWLGLHRIVALLEENKERDIYEAGGTPGEFWITYQGGGPFRKDDVMKMVDAGLLHRKYATGECYVLLANGQAKTLR